MMRPAQVMEVFAELDCKMVAKHLRDGRFAKAAAGRKAVATTLSATQPPARDASATPDRLRPNRKPSLALSSCVALATPIVRSPQPSTQKGASPDGPRRGRLQPCATSPCGRSPTDEDWGGQSVTDTLAPGLCIGTLNGGYSSTPRYGAPDSIAFDISS